jgi:hypothetical protein
MRNLVLGICRVRRFGCYFLGFAEFGEGIGVDGAEETSFWKIIDIVQWMIFLELIGRILSEEVRNAVLKGIL